jgi:hypothetical protein
MWLVIGDLHAGGVRPPLPLGAVVTALERLLADPTAGLDDLFWPVVFPGGAAVDGDREAFLAGEPTTLRLDAKIIIEQTPRGPRRLLVSVPYDVNVDELVQRLADQGRMWRDRDRFPRVGRRAFAPVLDVQDESTLRTGLRIAVRLDEDAPDAEGLLQAVWGVHRMVDVRVPGGPGGALRAWFAAHAEAGLPAAVALLRDVAEGRGAGRVRHVAGPERWTPPPPSAAVVAEWASTGLAPGEIGPLLSADGELTPQEWQAFVEAGLADVAETWIALGFAADEARSWTEAGVWPYEARVWRASGRTASDVPPIEDRALPVLPPGGAYGWTAYVPLEARARRYGAVDPPGTRGREARRSPDGRRGGRSIGD